MSETTEKKNAFPRPNKFIYRTLAFFVRFVLSIKTKSTYNLDEVRKINGPAVIMVTHTSNLDFLSLAVGLLPLTPTYIMSNHFFVHPKIGPLLKPLHAIPKKMFCADVNAVRQILKAIKAGNVVVMFPEGRLSSCGHSVQLADGTAELLKKLAVDVYWVQINGLYKTLPKWGKAGIRKGPVSLDGGLLCQAEEIKNLSVSEIEKMLATAMVHDDEKSFPGAKYKCSEPALGLEGILYKCPICGKEFRMISNATSLKCTACGESWTLDEAYVLHGKKFNSINAWFDWEQNDINLDKSMETDCILATPDKSGIMDREAGFGHISVNRDEIHFVGTCWNEALEFTEKTPFIRSFPITVGDHFDIYSNKTLYNIIPQPNPDEAIKFVQYMDKLASE